MYVVYVRDKFTKEKILLGLFQNSSMLESIITSFQDNFIYDTVIVEKWEKN